MKYIVILILLFSSETCSAQNNKSVQLKERFSYGVFDSSTIVKKMDVITLTDSVTNKYFELDSTHTKITAFDSKKNLLWSTDPWLDNNIPIWRVLRPVIMGFVLSKTKRDFVHSRENIKEGEPIINISYNNTQFGFIIAKTGVFVWLGQD